MRMQKFRVQNYKKIEDTDWVECGDITTFVGKNEAGKSALFKGLSKINPSEGEKYDGLKEFPRRRYASEFKQKDWPVSSVVFKLDDNDVNALTEVCSALGKVSEVVVTRFYSNKYTIKFKPESSIPGLSVKSYLDSLNDWKTIINNAKAPEGQGERLGQIKTAINDILTPTIQSLEKKFSLDTIDTSTVQKVSDTLTSNLNEEWEQNLFNKIVDKNNKFLETTKIADEVDKATDWVLENMPQYIYFDRYDMIDSAIHIDEFIRKINDDPDEPRLRITKCLFQHVGLDIEEISALDPNDEKKTVKSLRRMADERHINMSSASAVMTEKFSNWWEQRKHKFRYQVDGQLFRVWVSDDLDPSEIELDQRSAGMQYFFSFYLVFLVEASDAHKNSILLLDEPGLHYHGTAQRKAVKFLQKISKDNQLLYTTHSPFMIDGDRLNDVRIIYEHKEKGHTLVSSDVWPDDPDSLFPLQAGLGYSLAQTLFYSKYNFVVEGITDYSILKAMNELLGRKKMKTLDSDIVITPSGGTRNMMPLASMLIGNKLKLAVLLDGDQPGIQKEKQLKEKLLVNCLLVSSFVGKENAETEDLFPEEFYMKALKEAYPNKEVQFNEKENSIICFTERIEKVFERLKLGDFEKWRVANVLIDWIQKDSGENKISNDTCKTFEKIFTKVNELLKK